MSQGLRVMVVDDSAFNRRTIGDLLGGLPDVEVIGTAADGDEALKMAAELEPDLITLDLEMPRMDGFTFLRLLMARKPTPVIVVSGNSARENVFRAHELAPVGARTAVRFHSAVEIGHETEDRRPFRWKSTRGRGAQRAAVPTRALSRLCRSAAARRLPGVAWPLRRTDR